jgi:D-glycero-alpha-D-manno-heptose-7-phosphate kinase
VAREQPGIGWGIDETARAVVRARAPMRIGLAGGGTDLSPFCDQYGGCILNATIAMYAGCTITLRDSGAPYFRAHDLQIEEPYHAEAALRRLRLHQGVYDRVVRDFHDGIPLPVTVETSCDAPMGSGLGGSSTLVVAMLQAFAELLGLAFGEYELAQFAWEIERIDLGFTGGRQDQYAATFGGFNFMEFSAENRVLVNPLRIKEWIVAELESTLLLYDSGASRVSSSIIDGQIRNVVAQDQRALGAMMALKQEAVAMKEDLLRGRIPNIAMRLHAGWEAKKRTAGQVTNPLVETAYDTAIRAGARGGKVSGAGGGGFIVFFVEPRSRSAVAEALRSIAGSVYPCRFVDRGSTGWRIV